MSLIKQNIRSLRSAERQLERVAKRAIVENLDYILFLLKEKQLGEGIRSDGKGAPFYAPSTIDYAQFNPPRTGESSKSSSDRFNYEWSGTWIDSLYIKLEKDGFDILARDNKTALLEKLSRGKITALTEKNNKLINEEIVKPKLFEYMINALVKF
jgi:hypothetical protein